LSKEREAVWTLVGEIVVFLAIAAVLGGVVGWLLGRLGRKRAASKRVEEALASGVAERSDLEARLEEHTAEIERLRGELAPFRIDDLKLINGIGPVFERSLNAMGHCTYEQVAAWTRDDIRNVAAEIDLFPDRIVRDQWVEQAAALAAKKKAGEQLAPVDSGEPDPSDEGSSAGDDPDSDGSASP
jgi:predicted flap endonuclease-1-like 5' DNA nuclease